VIRILPPEVVNQIAAGEVIERPFSVVKELVENSLDAGARRIAVELRDGGRTLIRVTDDGSGFSPADLALAFVGHATSKLAASSDLERIASLGFRGEALASIGAVARASIRSRRAQDGAGVEIDCAGGAMGEVRPCGAPPGTTIEVRDLFYNLPARRRFLRTPQAERARVQDMLVRLALARLEVDFTLLADGREALRLPGGEDLAARIERCFGRALAGNLHAVERRAGDYHVAGLVGDPDAARRDATLELLWINGRCARERGSVHAIRQAYREYLMGGRLPVYFLMLTAPPDRVDVNVHPAKAEVRFVQAREICGFLHDAVQHALARRGARAAGGAASAGAALPRARSGFPELSASLFGPPQPLPASVREAAAPLSTAERPHPFRALRARRCLQVHDLYLVVEGEDGMVVVDQHALHERILYERLRARAGSARVQRLLVPEIVELTPIDKAWLLEARELLATEGFLLEDFGGNSIAVQGLPAVLGAAAPGRVLETFLRGDGAGDVRPRARAAIVERFHSMACRAAVMSGDRLTEEEALALLEDARGLEHPHNCPHGRPTVLTFGRVELEKYFRRRV
jgi:DNA mismatch repair protein MutL